MQFNTRIMGSKPGPQPNKNNVFVSRVWGFHGRVYVNLGCFRIVH